MKQGNLQALFYQGVDSHDPEDKGVFTIMALFDGWFNTFEYLCSVVTILPTSDTIVYFLNSQKTYFDVIGGSQTMKLPFGTFANEDAVAFHGLPDMVPFPVFWSRSSDGNTYFDLKLVQEQKVEAGKDLKMYVHSDNLIGANATGELLINMEHKQIHSPRKFS